MTHSIRTGLALAALAAGSTLAQAQTVIASDGQSYKAASVSDITTGSSMTNMRVHVCLTSGCTDKSWGSLTGGYSGVEQAGLFRIRVEDNADTFVGLWRFDLYSANSLVSVRFDGQLGNTIFDRSEPPGGSPGSLTGRDADLINQCVVQYLASNCATFNPSVIEYTNRVAVNNIFYGDEYESVVLNFGATRLLGPDAAGGLNYRFTTECKVRAGAECEAVGFYLHMDSDNAMLSAAVTVPGTVVPEPSTVLLLAAGLVAAGVAARRGRTVA